MRSFLPTLSWRRVRLIRRVRLVLAVLLAGLAALSAVGGAPATASARAGPSWSAPPPPVADPGTAAVPIRLADPAVRSLVRPGDRVDVLAVSDAGATSRVASGVLVLSVPATDEGSLLVVAVPQRDVPDVVGASARAQLAVTLPPP